MANNLTVIKIEYFKTYLWNCKEILVTIHYIDTVDICWKYGELTIEIVLKRGLYLFLLKKDILSLSWKKVQYLAPLIL